MFVRADFGQVVIQFHADTRIYLYIFGDWSVVGCFLFSVQNPGVEICYFHTLLCGFHNSFLSTGSALKEKAKYYEFLKTRKGFLKDTSCLNGCRGISMSAPYYTNPIEQSAVARGGPSFQAQCFVAFGISFCVPALGCDWQKVALLSFSTIRCEDGGSENAYP